MTDALVGRRLAEAAHPICQSVDAEQRGLRPAEVEAAVLAAGVQIGGSDPRQVLGTALNISQDLFEAVAGGKWRWIEPVQPLGEGLSGIALAEEAYRLAILHDPKRAGLHYEVIKGFLLADGVIIRGTSPGRTVYRALFRATHWFEWVSSATFRWK